MTATTGGAIVVNIEGPGDTGGTDVLRYESMVQLMFYLFLVFYNQLCRLLLTRQNYLPLWRQTMMWMSVLQICITVILYKHAKILFYRLSVYHAPHGTVAALIAAA